MKGDLAVSWGRGVWVSVSDTIALGSGWLAYSLEAIPFSATIYFAMKCSAPCSAVLRHSPSPWAAVVHWSALMRKALRSSRKHPIHSSFSWPPTQPTSKVNNDASSIFHCASPTTILLYYTNNTRIVDCCTRGSQSIPRKIIYGRRQ